MGLEWPGTDPSGRHPIILSLFGRYDVQNICLDNHTRRKKKNKPVKRGMGVGTVLGSEVVCVGDKGNVTSALEVAQIEVLEAQRLWYQMMGEVR